MMSDSREFTGRHALVTRLPLERQRNSRPPITPLATPIISHHQVRS
jgi:hypothetical protein